MLFVLLREWSMWSHEGLYKRTSTLLASNSIKMKITIDDTESKADQWRKS